MPTYICGNQLIREGVLQEVGDHCDTHAHNFDHTTYIPRGAARIEIIKREVVDGVETVTTQHAITLRAGLGRNWALIRAGVEHRIVAQEASTLYHCIYPHRNHTGEIVEEYDGWQKAYE
jgi:hypothetical protein